MADLMGRREHNHQNFKLQTNNFTYTRCGACPCYDLHLFKKLNNVFLYFLAVAG